MLSLHGVETLGAATPAEALRILQERHVDAVIQDMNFNRGAVSGSEGVELFHEIRRRHENLPVILLTAWTRLETAVDLVKAGAVDYVAKPWDDARILTTLRNLIELRNARAEAEAIRRSRYEARIDLAERYRLCGIVYESDSMHTLVAMATQIACADVPVLITGPSGAGKEVLADIIQANSIVRNRPYVKTNLGALPHDLIEAELFGTESGAFTGARTRPGRFHAAEGGTLFLDEIANLSPAGQAKLLRVLQTGQYEPLGSNATRRASVRVIAATNANLRIAIREGTFRDDLFYRLNVIELEVPPLRERRDDIIPLATHFLQSGYQLDPGAQRKLLSHDWPGNVRELQNAVRRACLLSHDQVLTADMISLPRPASAQKELELDRAAIQQALDRSHGIVAYAARELGLSRQALYRRMEKLGLKAATGGSPGHGGG
jgi:DNA-binding NtrC family response regulator